MIRAKKTSSIGRKSRTVIRMGQRRQVVIPKNICDDLGLRKGDFVEVLKRTDHVVIKPKKPLDLEETLTPEEEKVVARGIKQIKRGEYVIWDDLKNELGL